MFNPCGMWVDYLHSFYRMPCKLIIGGVPTIVTLRWYKAPAGAQRLPFGSAIFSHVWDNNPGESIPGEIGEVGAPRTWDPGNNVGYQGQCYRGDPTWFQTGQLPALAGIPASPCLCQIPPAFGSGTLMLSGSAVAFVPVLGCAQCPRGAPPAWSLTVVGASAGLSWSNGTWRLPYISGCNWSLTVGAGRTLQVIFSGGTWIVRVHDSAIPATAVLAVEGSFACLGTSFFQETGSPPPYFPTGARTDPSA